MLQFTTEPCSARQALARVRLCQQDAIKAQALLAAKPQSAKRQEKLRLARQALADALDQARDAPAR